MYYRLFVILACVCFVNGAMAQYGTQFQNRGFEEWADFGSSSATCEPINWHSGMSASGSLKMFLQQQIAPSEQTRPGSKGKKSVRMWPRSILGIPVNANLTNGRMNAGSMIPTGNKNYNYTQRSEKAFNTPISVVPDSLTVWVCFRSVSSTQNAQIITAVHGDADCRFIADATQKPADKIVASNIVNFHRTAAADGPFVWRRLTIPYKKASCSDPKYILFTITTNEHPGYGDTDDDMYVDDVLLIYNPSIETGRLQKQHYEVGEEMIVPFTLTGTMSPENLNAAPNQIIAQLSDKEGSFAHPSELGRRTTNVSGNIKVTIPKVNTGDRYRVRVVSTNYPMVAPDNGSDIIISHGKNM